MSSESTYATATADWATAEDSIRITSYNVCYTKLLRKDPVAACIPDVLFNNQGRIAAIAVDRDYEAPLRHPSEGAAYLDSLLEARGRARL